MIQRTKGISTAAVPSRKSRSLCFRSGLFAKSSTASLALASAAPSAGADPFGVMPAEPAAPAAGADPFGAPAASPAAGADPFGAPAAGRAAAEPAQTPAMARSVLIIRQTPAAHDEIQKVIRRVEEGDPKEGPAQRPFVTSLHTSEG
jgi:hypothetical protein